MIEAAQSLISHALARLGKNEDAEVAEVLRAANVLLNQERRRQEATEK